MGKRSPRPSKKTVQWRKCISKCFNPDTGVLALIPLNALLTGTHDTGIR